MAKVTITFEDRGAQTVEYKMDLTVPQNESEKNRPTPSTILAMAVKALFHNGMLASAGQLALEGASKGENPAEYIAKHKDAL